MENSTFDQNVDFLMQLIYFIWKTDQTIIIRDFSLYFCWNMRLWTVWLFLSQEITKWHFLENHFLRDAYSQWNCRRIEKCKYFHIPYFFYSWTNSLSFLSSTWLWAIVVHIFCIDNPIPFPITSIILKKIYHFEVSYFIIRSNTKSDPVL